jgi:hypothetical protein
MLIGIRHDGIQKHPNQKNISIQLTHDFVSFKKKTFTLSTE